MSHLKRWLRVKVLLPIIIIVAFYNGFWQLSLFHFGFFLAEIHADITPNHDDPPTSELNFDSLPIYKLQRMVFKRPFTILKTGGPVSLFVIGLYFCSYPETLLDANLPTGYGNLTLWRPPAYKGLDIMVFWRALGAKLICFSILFLPPIQNVLCTRFRQYLGKISFSLYLAHVTMN
ncbi:hypothetical protein AOL_s00097g84 [Orbilia oligospora ATCC 24927]|uniref:Acyltransferase 3 domain-containing protein n=2 Tax=Orbilia oligospora TaxID=2813651 RepID=G1XIA7_ARTOA|nr:hypothetical protein AOL_s00097g84 [Orbilia oligospora ATCC 24927]EGX47038.1 hypothetical protein AOL_s00097g84 [Orbilia oligospora ATCC 24927]KAF3277952.1 hypothetical protein TWF970_004830 [Orbilia oligospora]